MTSARIRTGYRIGYIALVVPFVLSFFTRFAPGSLADPIVDELHFSATELALATGTYFYVYTLMQLPAGALIDRIGIRWAVGAGTVVSAGGLLLYSAAQTIVVAILASAIIGLGSSTTFLGILRAVGFWFTGTAFALMSGVTMLVGNIGSLAAGGPLTSLLTVMSWRELLAITAGVSLAAAAAVLVLRSHVPGRAHETPRGDRTPLIEMIRDRRLIGYALIAVGTNSTFYTFSSLWGTPYLGTLGVPVGVAATIVSVSLLVYGLVSLAIGLMSDRMGSNGTIMVTVSVVGVVGWVLITIATVTPGGPVIAVAGLFLSATAAGSVVVVFSLVNDYLGDRGGASALAVVNGAVFLFVAVLQQIVGAVLDIGNRSTVSYTTAMATLTAIAAIGLVAAVISRSTTATTGESAADTVVSATRP